MKLRAILTPLFIACLTVSGFAGEESDRKARLEEAIKARLSEHAAKKLTAAVAPPVKPEAPAKSAAPAATPAPIPKNAAPGTAAPKEEPVIVLPKVEVNRARITELERELHEKDLEIARETGNTKASELDQTLNNPKISSALAIFGGKSSEVNESLAMQRVRLLEAERDVLAAMLLAKTQAEKDALQKELAAFKAMRRDLDHAPK